MSAHLINKVKKTKTGHPLAKAILFYLADCETKNGCYPSQKTIAEDMEISEASVKRYIKYLESKGLISRTTESVGGRITKTRYTFFDGVRENPSDGVCGNGSERPMVSDRPLDGVPQNPPIYKEVLNDNITTNVPEADASPVGEVFEFYKEHLDHPKSKLTKDKRDKIGNRLKEGYTVEDLKNAIRGCKLSPHHMGKNESGTVYDSVELIFRNGSKVEQFMGYLNRFPQPEEAVSTEDPPVFQPNNNRLPYELWVECAFIKSPPEEKILMYPKVRADYLSQWPNTEAEINEYEQTAEYRENYVGTGQIGNGVFVATGRGTATPQSKVPVSH